MDARLDRLLQDIDPERTILEMERLADQALNTFDYPGACVHNWEEFKECTTRFFRHADAKLLNLEGRMPSNPAIEWGRTCRLLMKEFGSTDGDKTAALVSMHGIEGGLLRVLKAIAYGLAAEYAENAVRARISAYWNRLSNEEKWAATDEYLAKFGHLLPTDVTEGGAARLRAFFPQFLAKHPFLTKRLRSVGR